MTTTPPLVSGGLPVLGHMIQMLRDRNSLFERGHKEHGDLFTIKLGPLNAVVITGEENNRIFYSETDKALNMQEGYGFLKEAIGEILFTSSVEDYYNQRPALQEVFKGKRMAGYIQAMNIEVQRWLDSLGESGEMDITQAMMQLAQYVAGRAMIGANYEQELGANFWKDYGAIAASLDPVLPPTLPLPKFWRRDQAKKKITAKLKELIQARRDHLDQNDDLITTLLKTPMKDGTFMPDDTIVIMFMGLLFAGHETTAGQAAWTIAHLLQYPEYLKRVQNEINSQLRYGQALDASTLSKLDHIYWAIDETTRLRPSADTQLRTVTNPLKIGEYEIPAGWRMMVSGATSHFKADVFNNPEHYDPMRYCPERGEGKNPFAIIGFGGGVHKCTGMNFAKNEMAVITALLFQQFHVQLISKDIKVVMGNGANHPSEVRVRYQRKSRAELEAIAAQADPTSAAACPVPHQ